MSSIPYPLAFSVPALTIDRVAVLGAISHHLDHVLDAEARVDECHDNVVTAIANHDVALRAYARELHHHHALVEWLSDIDKRGVEPARPEGSAPGEVTKNITTAGGSHS